MQENATKAVDIMGECTDELVQLQNNEAPQLLDNSILEIS